MSVTCAVVLSVGTAMVIIMLLASLNSCVNPWIYLSFNDHVTLSWLCRRRAKQRYPASSGSNTGGSATTRASRPGSRAPLTGDTALRRLARPARSTTVNDRRRSSSVDLWCYFSEFTHSVCVTYFLKRHGLTFHDPDLIVFKPGILFSRPYSQNGCRRCLHTPDAFRLHYSNFTINRLVLLEVIHFIERVPRHTQTNMYIRSLSEIPPPCYRLRLMQVRIK